VRGFRGGIKMLVGHDHALVSLLRHGIVVLRASHGHTAAESQKQRSCQYQAGGASQERARRDNRR
jgi:hypothetical protein